jgi:hypothetical protein
VERIAGTNSTQSGGLQALGGEASSLNVELLGFKSVSFPNTQQGDFVEQSYL